MNIEPKLKADGTRVRAVGLLSGGLDSTLAAKMIQEQGVEVIGINFSTGFCRTDHHRAMGTMGKEQDPKRLRNEALRTGADLEIPVRIVDISADYMDVVLAPSHGYGANMNPCLDCRAYMVRAAGAIMREEKADFVFTGEVLGQRPMSQHLTAMKLIEKESGLTGLLLRPLSAQLLAPTLVETEGWVDRESLLRIQGRTRKEQMRMASESDLGEIPSPSGGCCFLTDEVYASRFHDLLMHMPEGGRPDDKDVLLLKVGRHFRLSDRYKLIVGREEAENRFLETFFPDAPKLEAREHSGPIGLIYDQNRENELPEVELLRVMGSIVARYGKGKNEKKVAISLRRPGGDSECNVEPLCDDDALTPYRIPEKFDSQQWIRQRKSYETGAPR